MTRTVSDLIRALDALAPFSSCMEWDNVGLLIGDEDAPLTGVLVTLDVTPEAVAQAKRVGASLILSHHPVIFNPLKRLPANSIPALCLREGIAVVSAHTNYDFAPGGVNFALARALDLQEIVPFGPEDREKPYLSVVVFVPSAHIEPVYEAMSAAGAGRLGDYASCGFFGTGEGRFLPLEGAHPFLGAVGTPEKADEIRLEMLCAPQALPAVLAAMKSAHPYEEPAYSILPNHALHQQSVYGMLGQLPHAVSCRELALAAEAALHTHVCFSPVERPIQTVAVCGGAGSDFMREAATAGADAFLTGEVKHHEWFMAKELSLCLLAGGHHATENIAMPQLAEQVKAAFPELLVSLFDSDPILWA